MIKKIVAISRQVQDVIKIVYMVNYDMEIAKMLTSGPDLGLNAPQRSMDASGTSGMKAVHNGIPNLSVLDGWWIEGYIEGVTGWSIGSKAAVPGSDDERGTWQVQPEISPGSLDCRRSISCRWTHLSWRLLRDPLPCRKPGL